MFNLSNELNKQANKICNDLIAAKRAAKGGKDAAYHRGRAEELAKWLESVEALIDNLTEKKKERAENGGTYK